MDKPMFCGGGGADSVIFHGNVLTKNGQKKEANQMHDIIDLYLFSWKAWTISQPA